MQVQGMQDGEMHDQEAPDDEVQDGELQDEQLQDRELQDQEPKGGPGEASDLAVARRLQAEYDRDTKPTPKRKRDSETGGGGPTTTAPLRAKPVNKKGNNFRKPEEIKRRTDTHSLITWFSKEKK